MIIINLNSITEIVIYKDLEIRAEIGKGISEMIKVIKRIGLV